MHGHLNVKFPRYVGAPPPPVHMTDDRSGQTVIRHM